MELRDLRQHIRVEEERILQSLSSELNVATVHRATLENDIGKLEQEAVESGEADLTLRELEREANASRTLYGTLLSREEEALAQEKLQDGSVAGGQMASAATVPTRPSFPNPARTLGVGFVAAALLGSASVMLREKLARGITGPEETEALTGIRVLALVPRITKRITQEIVTNWTPWTNAPDFGEAMRRLQTTISLQWRERQLGKAFLVTSSTEGEGKSLLCAALGLQVVRSGMKCVLVDCDFRRSRTATMFGSEGDPGLANLLANPSIPSDIIQRTGVLDVVQTGMSSLGRQDVQKVSAQLPMIFDSDAMQNFLVALRQRYEVIIVDAPPMLVSDSLVLSKFVDGTIYVVQWDRTRREAVLAGLKNLTEYGANIEGIVLSQVDTRKYSTYGYSSMLAPRPYSPNRS
jgi:capsular exopolysaccharide synthesis family protein